MKQNDPTDHALAAIASIFGPARQPAEGEDAAAAQPSAEEAGPSTAGAEDATGSAAAAPDPGIDGYTRSGPGPLDSLRFRWTARRGDDGEYYVDETIGYASRPIRSGPIPRDQVIAFIDQRESESRQRFDALRTEMIRGASERGAETQESERIEARDD